MNHKTVAIEASRVKRYVWRRHRADRVLGGDALAVDHTLAQEEPQITQKVACGREHVAVAEDVAQPPPVRRNEDALHAVARAARVDLRHRRCERKVRRTASCARQPEWGGDPLLNEAW